MPRLFSRRPIPQLFFASLQPVHSHLAKCLSLILPVRWHPGFPLLLSRLQIICCSWMGKFQQLFLRVFGGFYEGWRALFPLRKSWFLNLPHLQELRNHPILVWRGLCQIAWKKFLVPNRPALVQVKALHLNYLHLKLFFLRVFFFALTNRFYCCYQGWWIQLKSPQTCV